VHSARATRLQESVPTAKYFAFAPLLLACADARCQKLNLGSGNTDFAIAFFYFPAVLAVVMFLATFAQRAKRAFAVKAALGWFAFVAASLLGMFATEGTGLAVIFVVGWVLSVWIAALMMAAAALGAFHRKSPSTPPAGE
jgi:hypothetical protein